MISVRDLVKEYRIAHQGDRPSTLAEAVLARIRQPMGATNRESFRALDEVSFDVQEGEVLGVIGRNGAGKSTLLKVLSRITEPTAGEVRIRGKVASLLEVGTGFHPELTGRENIFLNGSILGMRRREIERQFDAIVDFAEVERFLDTPVKRYSSGMYVRLAFAVAAHLNPEILIIDEVLSVGDAAFQEKCLGKMQGVSREQGRTVLFVSHHEAAVRGLCNRCILLSGGRIAAEGSPSDVYRVYRGDASNVDFSEKGRTMRAQGAVFRNAYWTVDGVPTRELLPSHLATLVLEVDVNTDQSFSVEFLIRDSAGQPVAFVPCGLIYGYTHTLPTGMYRFEIDVDLPIMASGEYSLELISGIPGKVMLDQIEHALRFSVNAPLLGSEGWDFRQDRGQGCLTMNVRDVRSSAQTSARVRA
ncbi:MAG TPA: polysaccharide ABC transporter ATP-binding protein [Fimbriimonadaceae bacterium]|nr:polysaccharide ABC transporter ATP-binding protein [Fimbriimonadaceae bacterium]